MNPSWRNDYLRYKSLFLNVFGQYKENQGLRYYLEIFLSLATVSLFSIFALRPTILTIADLIKQIDEREETLLKMNTKIAQINSAQILYDFQKENIVILSSAVPKSAEPADFARQIEGLSARYELTITDLMLDNAVLIGNPNPQAVIDNASIDKFASDTNELKFTIRGEVPAGSYSKIISFAKDIENLRRPAKVDSLLIESSEPDEEEQLITITISGRLPYTL